jgi:hypothetical protein
VYRVLKKYQGRDWEQILLTWIEAMRYRANLAILLSFGRKGLSSERNEIHRTNSPITDLGVQSQLGLLGQLVSVERQMHQFVTRQMFVSLHGLSIL